MDIEAFLKELETKQRTQNPTIASFINKYFTNQLTPFVYSRPYKEFKNRTTDTSYIDLAMEYALNATPLQQIGNTEIYIDRPYKVNKEVVELTLIDPISTNVSLELSIYAYLTKQKITKGVLYFVKKNKALIRLNIPIMSDSEVKVYLDNWKTETCSYEPDYPTNHCSHCGMRWKCAEERGINETKVNSDSPTKKRTRKSSKDTTN